MSDYQPLGTPGPNTAAADTTGRNSGNLSNVLDQAFINIRVPVFECYHMIVSGVPAGASAQILVNSRPYSFTFPLLGSEWDPAQPMLLNNGDEIAFLWSVVAATTPLPVVTAWFRFDAELPVNAEYVTRVARGN